MEQKVSGIEMRESINGTDKEYYKNIKKIH